MANNQREEILGQGGRVPPQAVEVEEVLLGSILVDSFHTDRYIAEVGNEPEIFYKTANRHIYEAILSLHRAGKTVDLITVENELRNQNVLAEVGGATYLSDLTRSGASVERAGEYALILREKWMKRTMILHSSNIVNMGYDPVSDPYDMLDIATAKADEVANKIYRKQGDFVSDLMSDVLKEIENRKNNPGISGIPSGMPIDGYTGGWQNGSVYIIAARPSIGKTAFVLKAAFFAALTKNEKHRANVFYWNGEMKNTDLIKRQLAVVSGVNYLKMRDGNLSDQDMKEIVDAAGKIFNGTFMIDDTPGIDINEFRAKYKSAVRKHNIGLGVVDYLQLMSGLKEGTREQEISSISRGLKAAAKETNTPILALSQLSRECEKREGCEPFLSDLRESGSLEQDADGVIMLNRPEFFGKGTFKGKPTKGKGIVKVAKMRMGTTGDFWMDFKAQYAEWRSENEDFVNNVREQAPPPHSIPD